MEVLEEIRCNDDIILKKITLNNTSVKYNTIVKNKDFLKRWLGWVDYYTEEAVLVKYTKSIIKKFDEDDEFVYDIYYKNNFVGCISVQSIDSKNNHCEIGYWLDESYNGNGIMTISVKELVDYCFNNLGFNKVYIYCATENYGSQAIPKKLNFELEGCLVENECLYGKYIDNYVFGMLKKNWR